MSLEKIIGLVPSDVNKDTPRVLKIAATTANHIVLQDEKHNAFLVDLSTVGLEVAKEAASNIGRTITLDADGAIKQLNEAYKEAAKKSTDTKRGRRAGSAKALSRAEMKF